MSLALEVPSSRRTFSPPNMRNRSNGRFRASEYSTHCEVGGHPRISGHILLREHFTPTVRAPLEMFDPKLQWVDLAQHVERMWGHYVAAVKLHSPSNVYPERFKRVDEPSATWRTLDRLPSRI